jgi:hypothetical protein
MGDRKGGVMAADTSPATLTSEVRTALNRLESFLEAAEYDALIPSFKVIDAELERLVGVEQRLDEALATCLFCGHLWRQHDPEDGKCDAHSRTEIGVCRCGRDLAWMQTLTASMSRAALAGEAGQPRFVRCGHGAGEEGRVPQQGDASGPPSISAETLAASKVYGGDGRQSGEVSGG